MLFLADLSHVAFRVRISVASQGDDFMIAYKNSKTRLLIGTALIVVGVPMASPAHAAEQGIFVPQGGPVALNNPEGTTVEGDKSGVYSRASSLTLGNEGTIRGNGSYDGFDRSPEGGVTIEGGPAVITNSGLISGAGYGISTIYRYVPETGALEGLAAGSQITNSGTIRGETNDGVRLIGGGSVTNSGLIEGVNSPPGGATDGVSMFAYDGQDTSGQASIGTITNQTGGTIRGARFGAILSGGGAIDNAGEMSGGASAILIQASAGETGKTGAITNGGTMSGADGVIFGGALASGSLTNSGTIAGTAARGVFSDIAGAVTIDNQAGGTITGATSGVIAEYGVLTVTNAGTIRGNGTADSLAAPPNGGVVIGQPGSRVTNSGTISGANAGITTMSAYNPATGSVAGVARNTIVENSGTIFGDSNDGVRLIGGGTVTNSGTIEGRANGARADGVSTYAFGGQDISGPNPIGTVVNQTGGTISGARAGVAHSSGGAVENAGAISGGAMGVMIQNVSPTLVQAKVTNSGTITGADAVVVYGDISGSTVTNSGTITGAAGNGVYQGGSGAMTLTNAADGTITGATSAVLADLGAIHIDNAGTIRGNGSYDGFDRAPEGGVTIVGGPSTITNSGTISGAGHGISTASYFNSATGLLEGRAAGSAVANSGTIIGETNDAVRLIGGGSVTNSGTLTAQAGAFSDGISMFAYADQAKEDFSASVVNEAAGAISGTRFGIILSGGGKVTNAGGITGVNGGIFIQGTGLNTDPGEDRGGLTASVVNSGTISGTRSDGLNGYGVGFGSDLSTATLENSGTISSQFGAGVFHGTLGDVTITNSAGGLITGGAYGVFADGAGRLSLVNAGIIRGDGSYEGADRPAEAGVTITSANAAIENSGTISGAGYGVVTQLYSNTDTGSLEMRANGTSIVNSGTIRGDGNDAIRLFGGGSVTNRGTIEGVAGPATDGITIQAFTGQNTSGQSMIGQVVNDVGGVISGERYGVLIASGGSVDNAGTISGALTGVVIGKQNSSGKVATLTNSGTIDGGVLIDVDTATASNSGTIRSDTGVAFASLGAVTLVNSGALAGGDGVAVRLGAFDDSVTLRTGSRVDGLIDAGDGVDGLTLEGDVLELTQAQQIGAASGFETLAVASGYWTSTGYVGEFDNVTISDGAALQVNEVDLGVEGLSSPILTPAVITNGRLILNFGEDEAVSRLDALSITGTGSVQLIGEAQFTVDSDSIAHSGGTTISNGGLILTGSLQGDVVTEGDGIFQLGVGGTEGSFAGDLVNNGRFIFNRSDDYDFAGTFSGTGALDKLGDGILTFMGDYSFEGVTNIMGGTVRIGGLIDPETSFNLGDGGTLDITGNQTIGGLSGDEGSNVVIGDSQLTVDQEGDSEFAGAISGAGGFTKDGDGTLNLTGDSDYSGPTSVDGGTLAVNGSIASPVTVNTGGTLGGNGTVGSTAVGGGGTIAPGNSIGRLTVAGNLAFAAGSVYEVEVNAAGAGDRIDATGVVTIASTARVAVLAENGNYRPRTDYTILTGVGGVSGTFGSVTTDLAFLDPFLRYGPNAVTLSLYRNDVDFADVAAGFNQTGVATAVQARGINDPLFEAVLVQNAAGAQAAYSNLSGEILTSTISGLTDDSRHVRNAILGMPVPAENGAFIWGSAFGGWGNFDAQAETLGMDTDHKGVVTGVGYGGNGFAAALSAGIGNSDFRLDGGNDRAKIDSKYLAAQASYGAGSGLRGSVGVAYAWHDIDTARVVTFVPLAQTLTSSRDADTLQIFGEVGYDLAVGKAAFTPFARLAHVRTKSDAFAETGGNAALALADTKQETTFLSLGARARFNAGEAGFQPYVSAAWNRAFDDRAPLHRSAFASGGGTPFAIVGALIPKNSAEVEAGFDYRTGPFSIGAAYTGVLASDRSAHGLRVTARISF